MGSSAFARHYLRNHMLFSSPLPTEMFQFGRFACQPKGRHAPDRSPERVAPFGHPRINASLQLPAAYRSLARPSSPLHAKASTVRPFLLVHAWLAQSPPTHTTGRKTRTNTTQKHPTGLLDLPQLSITANYHYVKELKKIPGDSNPDSARQMPTTHHSTRPPTTLNQ